jgi:signal transduction histidine kinase
MFRLLLLLAGAATGVIAAETPLVLTAEESAWIKAHPTVRVGFSPAFPPYSFPDQNGRLTGIDLDYLQLISARTGLKFEPVLAASWTEAEAQFHSGETEMLTALVGSQKQQASMLLSEHYVQVPVVIVSRTTTPYLLQAADLHGLKVGAIKGYLAQEGMTQALLEQGQVTEYASLAELLSALARGDIEATVTDSVTAAYNIKTLHLTNLRLGSVVEGPSGLHFGISKAEPLLVAVINKALATLTPAERRAIDDKWVTIDIAPPRWLLAFKISLGGVALALIFFLLLYLHNRRLEHELEQRRQVQAKLEDARMKLEAANEQKAALLRMVAHDIRSPLAGMLLGTDLASLTEPGDEQGLREIIANIRGATKHLQRLVSDVLDAQTAEDGARIYRWEEMDLRPVVVELCTQHGAAAQRKRVTVRPVLSDGPLPLISDSGALRQVIDNLLSNSLKYTRPGSEIRVEVGRQGAHYRLAFIDQGPGISPAECEQLFRRYGRGSARPTGGENSTGLGLWIVQSIVTGLHGRVYCTSVPGEGATFVVELPETPTVSA